MTLRFALPDVGEGLHEAEIVRWLVAAGDTVARDQPLVEIMNHLMTINPGIRQRIDHLIVRATDQL